MGAIALSTIADLEQHPGRCELIDGEILDMSPTGYEHSWITVNIGARLHEWARGKPFAVIGGDPGFIWDAHTVRAPDVAVLSAAQAAQAPARGFIPFPPLLAVEVVSPTDEWSAVKRKAKGWLTFGAQAVWIVDPDTKSIDVYTTGFGVVELEQADVLAGGALLPGFSVPVAELFR